jgi:hypothetical protein
MKFLISFFAITVITLPAMAQVNFTMVADTVLSEKCLLCHGNPAKDPKDLKTYADVSLFVIPGDAANSKLFQLMSEGKMPPPKAVENKPELALTSEDLALVEQWINEGAIE